MVTPSFPSDVDSWFCPFYSKYFCNPNLLAMYSSAFGLLEQLFLHLELNLHPDIHFLTVWASDQLIAPSHLIFLLEKRD